MISFQRKFKLRNVLMLILVPALILLSGILSANEVAVIKVKYRKAAELVPMVRSLLSSGGSVTVSERVNSLVVVDSLDKAEFLNTQY